MILTFVGLKRQFVKRWIYIFQCVCCFVCGPPRGHWVHSLFYSHSFCPAHYIFIVSTFATNLPMFISLFDLRNSWWAFLNWEIVQGINENFPAWQMRWSMFNADKFWYRGGGGCRLEVHYVSWFSRWGWRWARHLRNVLIHWNVEKKFRLIYWK